MKISVLIPTHNRPKLFKRCLESVLLANMHHKVDLEIIVNNDSNDIVEMVRDVATYHYEQSDNLSDIYKGLFEKATKEYVYFLEDDDIMDIRFFEILDNYNEDIFYFNYSPYNWNIEFVIFMRYANNDYDKETFLAKYDDHHFQFGQICFRKSCLDINSFPNDNNLHNDFKIFQRLNGSFRSINKILYSQTTDGGDNISFKLLNKDTRWIS